jgi:alkaline phosphatase
MVLCCNFIIKIKNDMKQIGSLWHLFLVVFFTISCSAQAEEERGTKNIILLIGDGMSFAHVQAGMLASNNSLNIQEFKYIGFIQTSSANAFVTDSGAAGTALASGVKTNNGAIGVDTDGKPVRSILQISSDNGLATGLVASSAITHATPAAFIAHQPSRNMAEAIALDFLGTDIDVFIGGGRDHFEKREDGRNLSKELEAGGYKIAYTLEEVTQTGSGKLAALLAPNSPPSILGGRDDMLPGGTETAISILSQNPGGFFLMVEGSQIDWEAHSNNVQGVVAEILDFDRAVGKAMEFARKDGNTLVIVTSDHDTGGMGLHGFDPEKREITAGWTTGGHTGLMQPVFAWGPGSENFAGIYENTAIFDKMLEAYGFSGN